MADENAQPECKIVITFAGSGSALMDVRFEHVIPTQIAAAAWMLERQAQAVYFQQELARQQQQAMGKIALPNQSPQILRGGT